MADDGDNDIPHQGVLKALRGGVDTGPYIALVGLYESY